MNIDVTSFHAAFFEEATELLDDFEGHLLELETTPEDRELLNSIFRCAHSIKGGSATFGFPEVARFTHSLETLLDGVRNGQVAVTTSLCALLLASLDQMRALLAVAKGDSTEAPDSDLLIEQLTAASAGTTSQVVAFEETQSWGLLGDAQLYNISFKPGLGAICEGFDPLNAIQKLKAVAEILTVDCDTSGLPNFTELDPSCSYFSWSLMVHTDTAPDVLQQLVTSAAAGSVAVVEVLGGSPPEEEEHVAATAKTPQIAAGASAPAAATTNKDGGTIKVSADKLDKLINLVGELIISQSMLNAVTQDFEISRLPRLQESVAQMERASRELQERVMGIRLLQIKVAFGRFPRLVHDLSSAVGKKIELKLVGEETELDKNLIEAIGDPLTHLVRNSVDHGLETPEERIAAGKSPVGTVLISAFHEGGSIVIEVADDGKGLSREKILAKAIERGLVSPDDSLSDEQVYNLTFLPGFSTAETVTDLSGRGVGMDIVKQAITGIGGSIKVSSKPGQGVSTRIRLPLTMAILEGQSMAVGDSVYIVPLTSIVESIRPRKEDLHSVAHIGEVVTVRGEYLPVVRLYDIFNQEPRVTNPWEASLVLVETEGRKVAIMADELIGQGQVVIKSLETNYRKVEGIAGATILGDGRVALIIDVSGLLRETVGQGGAHQTAA